jgi:hypothetical protein
MSKEFFWDRELQCGFCFCTGNWNSTTAWRKPSTRCPTSSSGTGNYSAAVVSIQGTGNPPQPRESQVSGVVQQVFLGQGITVQVLFIYRELELHYSLEEAKYQVSNQFFWDRELQCSCCFCTGNWNSTTA